MDVDVDVVVVVVVVVVVDSDVDLDVEVVETLGRRTALQHLRQHGDHRFEKLEPAAVEGLIEQLPQPKDIQRGSAFHRLASRDLVVLGTVCLRPATGSFGDVADDGPSGAGQLIAAVGIGSCWMRPSTAADSSFSKRWSPC